MSQLPNTTQFSDVIRWTEDSSYLDICMDRNTADQALALLQLKSVVHSSIFCQEEGCLGWLVLMMMVRVVLIMMRCDDGWKLQMEMQQLTIT